jgi:hypothetical protein
MITFIYYTIVVIPIGQVYQDEMVSVKCYILIESRNNTVKLISEVEVDAGDQGGVLTLYYSPSFKILVTVIEFKQPFFLLQ